MTVTLTPQTWAVDALCTQVEPDTLFVRGAAQRSARELCFGCPVRTACLAEALDSQTEFGVWGGLTERERRALLKRYPDVTDWAAWLAAAEHRDEIPTANNVRRRGVTARAAG